jgi:methylenetetrahydrofolate--tRNA-(uracil-5-)-methyltransferase
MNVNFGLFPPLAHAVRGASGQRLRGTEKTLEKKRALAARALVDLELWLAGGPRVGGDHAAAAE